MYANESLIVLLIVLALGSGIIEQAPQHDDDSPRAEASAHRMLIGNILERGDPQAHVPVVNAGRRAEASRRARRRSQVAERGEVICREVREARERRPVPANAVDWVWLASGIQ